MTEYTSVFTIHTKDGPLRRTRHAYGNKPRPKGTPYCTMTKVSAERIARQNDVVPCVIIETKTGYDSEKDIFFHQTIKHKIDE